VQVGVVALCDPCRIRYRTTINDMECSGMEVADRRLASEASGTAQGAWLPRLSGSSRLIVGLAAMMFVGGSLGGLIVPGPAAADPLPLWSDPITTSAWAVYGAGGREALYVNESQAGMLNTERVIGPDGAVEYEADTGNITIAPPALAVDGSGYVLRGGGVAGMIDAIDTAGKVRWSYMVPAGDTVRAMLVGSDGAAYVIVSNAIDDEVLRLSPVDGSVTFDTPLPDGTYGDGYLFAEPSGVAAVTGTHVLFLSQQGQVMADVPAVPSGFATVFTSNNAGDVFVGIAPIVGSEVNPLRMACPCQRSTRAGRLNGLSRRLRRVKNRGLWPWLPYPMAGWPTRSRASRSGCSTPTGQRAGTPKTPSAMELCKLTAQTTSISRGPQQPKLL
jgi:hypothetical protein